MAMSSASLSRSRSRLSTDRSTQRTLNPARETQDRIRDVQSAAVIVIESIETTRIERTEELVGKIRNRVGDIDNAVPIAVAAEEERVRKDEMELEDFVLADHPVFGDYYLDGGHFARWTLQQSTLE